jgi:hypothetical protein
MEATRFSETSVDFNGPLGVLSQKIEILCFQSIRILLGCSNSGAVVSSSVGIWTFSWVFVFCTRLRDGPILLYPNPTACFNRKLGSLFTGGGVNPTSVQWQRWVPTYLLAALRSHKKKMMLNIETAEIMLISRAVVSMSAKVKLSLRSIKHHVMKMYGEVVV